MMIKIIAISKKEPDWVKQACDMYIKRMPETVRPKIQIIKQDKEQDAINKIAKTATNTNNIIALDERGEKWSTMTLADKLNDWMVSNKNTSFIIGGADGLNQNYTRHANTIWSLSPLTLPHTMARVILLEQLYRAWSILQNHPYHRQ